MKQQRTWWGVSFIHSLESFIDSGRLKRGRSYSNENRVLQFTLKKATVTAVVKGNINHYFGVTEAPEYKIRLAFKAINEGEWQEIITVMCENPSWLSKLMLNEMPNNIEDAFAEQYFLPRSYQDIDATCSCPDYANPCKHIAGIYFKLAKQLDSNPMLLFQLRGLSTEKLHQALKKTELGKAFSAQISAPQTVKVERREHLYCEFKAANKIADNAHEANQEKTKVKRSLMKNVSQDRFWNLTKWPLLLEDEVPQISASLIKKQGDYPPFWDNSNSFVDAMEDIYLQVKRKNKKSLS
ncbi:MAG: SWIM zinc finger family protein [Oceanospirillaceae bacterium]